LLRTEKGEKMGNYNSQYESYYGSMVNKRKSYKGLNKKSKFIVDGSFFIKRLQRDLIGIFILFMFVILCKTISTSQTVYAYNYSKAILNRSFDYETAINRLKTLDINSLESKFSDFLDTAKTKIIGGKTLKERIKTDFIAPVENTSSIKKDTILKDGVDISLNSGAEIFAVFEGKVKDIGEDTKNGKYIIIDHGSGIETKYSKLNEISFKKGDAITKGQVLGKVEEANKNETPFLHFELSYMGESLNPEDYLSFK
jgi:murein DD-endopeptidase MepM/ murein hydrolase activator NlpD